MPSLKAIRKRITSVQSTQKITRAMKMVAGARLNRAQQRITELRPYAVKVQEVLWEITLDGSAFTTKYGKIGTDGQETIKEWDDDDKAKKEYDKLIAEKTKKGYKLVSGGGGGGAAKKAAVFEDEGDDEEEEKPKAKAGKKGK